jgi:hypothetical protein
MGEYWQAVNSVTWEERIAKIFAQRENGHYVKLETAPNLIALGYPSHYFETRWNRTQSFPSIKNQTRWSDDWSTIIPFDPNKLPPQRNLGLYKYLIEQGGGCIALGRGRRVLIGHIDAEKLLAAGDGFVDIKTSTPRIVAEVLSATSSWEPDTREKKHNHKNCHNKTQEESHP